MIGFLGVLSAAENTDLIAAFNQSLNRMGFADDRNVTVEYRWAEGRYDRLVPMAKELVNRRAVAIVAAGGAAALAAKGPAGGVIPVIFIEGDLDPVKSGLVASLDQPGGNLTGVLLSDPTVLKKRLELLQDAAPETTIGMLVNPQGLAGKTPSSEAEATARSLGLRLKVVGVTSDDQIDDAFATTLVKPHVGALLVDDDVALLGQRDRIVQAAAGNGLPAMYPNRAFVLAGGLMSYTADLPEAYRQTGEYTANVLLGRRPAELPVRQPTKFELVINRKAANALQIPQSLTRSADSIIEGITK